MTSVLKRIGTHDGVFHCDEVLACFMLKKLPEYQNSEIIRSRNPEVLNTCDIVVDVGGIYDPSKHRYDHHQKDFNHTMNSLNPDRPWKIKLSSAGLVYHHFGERILEAILGPPKDSGTVSNLFSFMYENFIQEVDGIDNGVLMFDGEPRYSIHTNLSSRVKYLNPSWNSEENEDSQKLFHAAMDLVGKEFIDRIQFFTKSFWPARDLVKEAILNRNSTHQSGSIIELKQCCPWKKHLFQLEKELGITGQIKYVIFQSDSWRIEAVPINPDSFVLRLPLHETWRGLRDEKLSKISGIDECIFVHSNGFIGGNKTREGALKMALKTLESKEENS